MFQLAKRLLNHPGFRRYAANISWLMAERVLRLVVGLFVTIWVARYLGPQKFGLLSYAQSFVFLFAAIATLGLDTIVVRELVKYEDQRDKILGTAYALKLAGACLIIPLLALAVLFTNNDHRTNVLIFIVALATFFQSFNVIDFYFQSKVISKYVAISNAVGLGLSTVIKVILILHKAPLIAFATMIVFDAAVLSIGLIYFYLRVQRRGLLGWRFDRRIAKKLLQDSWPLIFSGLVVSVYMKIDLVMVKWLLNEKAAGYYSAATRLAESWLFITVVITNSLYPAIVKAKEVSQELYFSRLKKMYQLLILISVTVSLITVIFSDQIIRYTFGESYASSIVILNIYTWSNVFVFMNNGSWSWYINEGLQRIAFLRLLAGALINVFLNVYLIRRLGIAGAAYATLISYAVASYLGNLISRKTWPNFVLQSRAIFGFLNFKSYFNEY